jgi:membrane protein
VGWASFSSFGVGICTFVFELVPVAEADRAVEQVETSLENKSLTEPRSLALAAAGSANGGIKAMFEGLNAVYHENEKRSFIRLNAISPTFTLSILGFVMVSLLTITIVPQLLILLVVASLMIAVIYRFGPSRNRAQWRWISPGSIFAAVVWIAASLLFSWYTSHFGSYNKTYGSLGAAIAFMTWMWISTIVILVGAKINAELEHQTAVDTTDEPPAPRAEGRARMADTIGPGS